MRRNSGIIGPQQQPTAATPGEVKVFDLHDRHVRGNAAGVWPTIKTITFLGQTNNLSSFEILQNDITYISLNATGFEGGAETLYYTLDLTGGALDSIFTAVNGSFTMNATNTGGFNLQTNFSADLNYHNSAFPKQFNIQIRTGSISGTIIFTSSTFTIKNFKLEAIEDGFTSSSINEGFTGAGSLWKVAMSDIDTAGGASGAIRYYYNNFLEFTSASGIYLNGGNGRSGSQDRYEAQSTNTTAGSIGSMIFTVRGVPNANAYYQFKSNSDTNSQARIYTDTGSGFNLLNTSNNTTNVTGNMFGLHHGDRIKFEFYNDAGGTGSGRAELLYLYMSGYGTSTYTGGGLAVVGTGTSPGVTDIYNFSYNAGSTYNHPNVFSSGQTSPIVIDHDHSTEGAETAHIQVTMVGATKGRSGNRSAWTQISPGQVTINDTSLDANISTNEPSAITEATSAVITVTNTGTNIAGTLYHTITNTSATAADFGNWNPSGSFSLTPPYPYNVGTVGSFTVDPVAENVAENETFQIQIRKNSTSGTILHTTNSIAITDAISTTKDVKLNFREVRYGTNVGTINVYIANATTGVIIGSSVYTATGNLGITSWQTKSTATTAMNIGDQFRWLFYYQDGGYWRSDYAIDNVEYVKDNVVQWTENFDGSGGSTQQGTWSTGPQTQNASATAATGWASKSNLAAGSSAYTNKWYIRSGSTPSSSTGPTGAYNGSYYCYTECSGSVFYRDYYLWSPIITV